MTLRSNISVSPNVWCDPDHNDLTSMPVGLESIIPGDLLVEFLGTREKVILERTLTRTQLSEYLQCRFFRPHGQEGIAFDQ
jgi:hypothetical protein